MNVLWFACGWCGLHQLPRSLHFLKTDNIFVHDFSSSPTIVNRFEKRDYDVVVIISNPYNPPPADEFLWLKNNIGPTILMMDEGSFMLYQPHLEEYASTECFSLIVNFDGNKKWVGSDTGITALTPISPEHWGWPVEWEKRNLICGSSGGINSTYRLERFINPISEAFQDSPIATKCGWRSSISTATYEPYLSHINFMKDCRLTLNMRNHPKDVMDHVKGRVIEAALAGSCLLEEADALTSEWFTPDVDYLTYGSVDDICKIVEQDSPENRIIAQRLRSKVLKEHSPLIFWDNIFSRLR